MQRNNQIGFIVNDTTASELSFRLIKGINDYLDNGAKEDFVLFVENSSANIIEPNFATMSMSEIWNFDGTLISTSVSTTLSMNECFAPKAKYFYVWDLEWIRNTGMKYEQTIQAFSNEGTKLIAKSGDHAKAIKNYSNKKVDHIIENINIKAIARITNE
jgi:hypothetical protein|tara:strand:+ start:1483 stop:1959 length:477 start_codon:yes stop_codon:yes gene_type:complete